MVGENVQSAPGNQYHGQGYYPSDEANKMITAIPRDMNVSLPQRGVGQPQNGMNHPLQPSLNQFYGGPNPEMINSGHQK